MSSASSLVDWNLAGRTARRLMSSGPATTREEAAAVVRDLHDKAAVAVAHVEGLTGLHPVEGGPVPEVAVVDRPGWVDANTAGMAALMDPLVQALTERQETRPGPLAMAIGSRATGVQAGGLLAFLSSRVLGQYEVFGTGGRLLLVAPNIVATEQKLGVDPSDFRLWVCLHEVTHQLQFTAVPWLKDHLEAQMAEFVEATDLDPDVLRDRLGDVLRSVLDAVRGENGGGGERKSTRLNSNHATFLLSRFFFNDTATTEIYTLSLHDALPILPARGDPPAAVHRRPLAQGPPRGPDGRVRRGHRPGPRRAPRPAR